MTHEPNNYYKAIGPPPGWEPTELNLGTPPPDWRDNRDPEQIGNKLKHLISLGMTPSQAAEYI